MVDCLIHTLKKQCAHCPHIGNAIACKLRNHARNQFHRIHVSMGENAGRRIALGNRTYAFLGGLTRSSYGQQLVRVAMHWRNCVGKLYEVNFELDRS